MAQNWSLRAELQKMAFYLARRECRLILVSHMEFLKLDTKVIRNFDNALAGEVEILATSTFSVLKGVVARIGCQVLTQALSVTRDMSGLCTR